MTQAINLKSDDEKPIFCFYGPDPDDDTVYTDINCFCTTCPSFYADVCVREEKFYCAQSFKERAWRNCELAGTDRLLAYTDTTYNGNVVCSYGTYLADILTYRSCLRSYNLTTDPRPIRPAWYTG